MTRQHWGLSGLLAFGCAVALIAQGNGQRTPESERTGRGGLTQRDGGQRGARGAASSLDIRWRTPGTDRQAVDRGQRAFAVCGACHGPDARGGGGKTTVDLLRSNLVLTDDRQGTAMGAYLRSGHPPDGMSPVLTTLTPETIADIATWVHYQIAVASERQNYQPLDVLAGSDAKKGEAYFSSHCASCHAVNGDFKAIGAKYASSPMNLQNAIVSGGGGGRGGRRGRGAAATPTKRVTVTLPSGEMISGRLRSIDAFLVSIDLDNGRTRSFFRNGNTPTVVVTDPMQGHLDLMSQYTDDDLHNLTAYLATLK